MAFIETLRILAEADTRGAVRGIENVGKASDKSLGKSQKTLDKWSKGLTTAGATAVAAGAVVLVGLGKAAQASEEANLAVVKLQNTLSNMPKLAGENTQQFIDLADAIQSKTAADADAIVEGEALLGTFQLTAKEIKGVTPLVVDYARKFGVDIPNAAIQVGKALDGQIGSLKRNGVSIDENLFKTDRYAAVTKALREQVGGFAEDEGKTFAGSLERLKNQLGDVAEGVGSGAVDAFTDLFGVIGGGLDKIKELSPTTQAAIGKVATFGSVALIAAGGFTFAVGQIIKFRQSLRDVGDAVAAARLRFAGLSAAVGPVGVGAALLAAGAGFAFYLKNQNEAKIAAAAEAFARLRDVTKETVAATGVLNDAVRVSTTTFTAGASVQEEFARTGKVTEEVMRDLNKAWDEIIAKNPAAAEGFIRTAEAAGVNSETIREWRGELRAKIAEDADAVSSQDEYNAKVQEASGVTDDATASTEEATSALQEYSDQLRAMTDPLFAAMDAITGNRDAQLAYRDAIAGVFEAQAALDEAISKHGPKSQEAAEATRGLQDAQRGLSDAQWGTVESAAQVDSAMAGLKDAVDRGDISVADFNDTLRIWVAQGFLTQDQAYRAAASIDSLARKAEDADKKRVGIPVSTPGSERSAGQLDIVRDKAFQIPLSRRITLSAFDRASGVVQGVISALNRIPSITTTTIRAQLSGSTIPGIQVRQHGGPVRRGEAYLVGEREAEVFVPDTNGTILPNVNTLAHMGGGGVGGGNTYITENHFHGPVVGEKQLLELVDKGNARRYGRNNVRVR